MNKTKIEWADMTWNPITGCLHGCEYCYARDIAMWFRGGGYGKEMGMFISKYRDDAFKPPYDLKEPQLAKIMDDWYREAPYPFGFAPTFHRYRLNEPKQIKKPQNIFVVSMGDLFGDWVPDEWIQVVLEACAATPLHRYLFLTKNPARYGETKGKYLHSGDGFWYGTTVTDNKDFDDKGNDLYEAIYYSERKKFLSIEPLLEDISVERLQNIKYVDWVIIGAETGNRKDKVVPQKSWIDEIVSACDKHNVPVFMKDSLVPIVGEESMRRELPWRDSEVSLF